VSTGILVAGRIKRSLSLENDCVVVAFVMRREPKGCAEDMRIEHIFELDMGIFRLKFTMNFVMNLSNHLQIIAALLLGGWWVYTDRLEIGGVVAFISAIGRLNDPWGDLVNYFRDLNVIRVKFRLLADAVDQLVNDIPARPPAPSENIASGRSYFTGY